MLNNSKVYFHPLMQSMQRSIKRYKLLSPGEQVLVALSGGADSVALLRALQIARYTPIALHCNFHLRGKESDRDEAFCKELTRTLDIELLVHHFETQAYAAEKRLSIEMAARELRYHVFVEEAQKRSIHAIAVGHHLQDNVETLLGNLSRGTGLVGLRGISPKRDLIIRPLLEVHPREIHDFLKQLGQAYCLDSTNQDTTIKRNAIRHKLIPLFEELNPSFLESTCSSLAHLREAEIIYKRGIEEILRQAIETGNTTLSQEDRIYSLSPLIQSGVVHTLLHYIVANKGFSADALEQFIQQIESLQPTRITSASHILEKRQGRLYLLKKERSREEERNKSYFLDLMQSSTSTPYGTFSFEIKKDFSRSCIPQARSIFVDFDTLQTYLKAQDTSFGLKLQPIDLRMKLQPFGFQGRKTIHKILKEKGIVSALYSEIPLLMAHDVPLWLVPYLRTNSFPITQKTQHCLHITYTPLGAD